MRNKKRRMQGGNAIVEFALAFALLAPFVAGIGAVSLAAIRYLQVGNVARSGGSMFVRGADFRDSRMQQVLGRLAAGTGFSDSSGNILTGGSGVVTFTSLKRVDPAECGNCANRNMVVITHQVVLGNTSLPVQSVFGTPSVPTNQLESDGSIKSSYYYTAVTLRVPTTLFPSTPGTYNPDTAAVASNPPYLGIGENTHAVETYFEAPELNIFPRLVNVRSYYHRYFF
jgi:hypothetical protein